MLKFRGVLIVCLVVISLFSYGQRDSTLNHKNFVGVGTDVYHPLENTIDPFWGRGSSIISAHIEYKRAFKYFDFKVNIEGIYYSVVWGRSRATWVDVNPSFGIEKILNPRSKLQFIYGVDLLARIWKNLDFPTSPGLIYVGIAPLIGVEYKIANNLYVVHELSIAYGPMFWRQNSLFDPTEWWWTTYSHKIFDITVYYGF